jgi:hypothetical protein
MTRTKKNTQTPARLPAFRPAFERLDAALAKHSRFSDIEKIQMARIALFGVEAVGGIRHGENSEVHP